MKLTQLTLNKSNPRFIKDDKFKRLCNSIKEFPKMMDLRPIVIDNENVIIGGNMRFRALKELGYKEVPDNWVKRADELTEDEKRRFIISDNAGFGEWDMDILANEWDASELEDWGVDIEHKIDNVDDGEEIEVEKSVQIEPPLEYILIMAEPNSSEWEELKQMLKLKMVRRGGYKKGSAFDAVALERVLRFNDFKDRLNADSDTK